MRIVLRLCSKVLGTRRATALACLPLAAAVAGCASPEQSPSAAAVAGVAPRHLGAAVPTVLPGGPADPPPPAPPSAAGAAKAGQAAARGAEVYAAQCASCHGPSAEGSALAFAIRTPSQGLARWVVRNGRKGGGFAAAMPAYSTDALPDSDLDAVLAWLQTFDKPSGGEALFRQYCSNCHGSDGSGGVVGENVAREAQHEPKEVLRHVRKGHGGQNYAKRKGYMPAFSSQQLSDDDVAAMVAWLRTLPPKTGKGAGGKPAKP